MSEWQPVETLNDLDTLDGDEIMEGYWAGHDGWPEPGNNQTRSFWHGWRNGAVDGHHREKDAAQAELARVVYERMRTRKSGLQT